MASLLVPRPGRMPVRRDRQDACITKIFGVGSALPVGASRIAFIAVVCTALLVGCATTQTTIQNRESMLVAAGFKVITPKTAAQQQKLQNLPPGKVTMIQKGKKTYYIFPDPVHNRSYVGGPKEYRAYQQLRATNKLVEGESRNRRDVPGFGDAVEFMGRLGSRLECKRFRMTEARDKLMPRSLRSALVRLGH